MTSVVVAAYNEASVIGRTLDVLTHAGLEDLEIVVVCNGCTDDTATIARSYGPSVLVVETPVANKTGALDLGDQAAHSYPRIYVDADITPSSEMLRALPRALQEPGVLAAAPMLQADTARSSWAVKAYSAIQQRLPQVRDSLAGRGMYALSEEGRRRFDEFPEVLNDDGYISALFSDGTSRIVVGSSSVVRMPRTLGELVRRRTRVVRGNAQLRRLGVQSTSPRGALGWLRVVVEDPRLAPALVVFLPTSAFVRLHAYALDRRGASADWGRDESSRLGTTPPGGMG